MGHKKFKITVFLKKNVLNGARHVITKEDYTEPTGLIGNTRV